MAIETTDVPSTSANKDAPAPALTEYVNGAVQTPPAAVEASAEPIAQAVAVEQAPKEDKAFGAKFAALSRKEKEQSAREKAFTTEKKAFDKMKADLKAEVEAEKSRLASKYIDPEEFKKDPVGLYKKQGLTFEQLAERVMNDGKPGAGEVLSDSEKRIQAQVDELKAQLLAKNESEKKREEEQKQRQLEETMTAFKTQLTDFCNKEADYELIRANDAVGLVYEVIEEHHKNTLDAETGKGQILSNKEAADAVENYLLEEAKKQIKLSKVKTLLAPVEPAAKEEKSGSPTLSNTHSAQSVPSSGQRLLSDEESRKEAAKLIKWQD